MEVISAITSRGANNGCRKRLRSIPHVVALWSVIALLLAASSVTASIDNGEQVCSEGSTEESCQAPPSPPQSEPWDSLADLSPENALIQWINAMDQGSVASEKFRIEKTENPVREYSRDVVDIGKFVRGRFDIQPSFDFYATEDIPQGTILMEIPKAAMIGGDFGTKRQQKALERFFETNPTDETEFIPACMVLERIVNEQEKGPNSHLYPFLQYLFGEGNPQGKQPATWSDKGKFVFWGMMGQEGAIFTPNKHRDKHRHSTACTVYKELSKIPHTIPITKDSGNEAKATRENLENAAFSYFAKHAWGLDLIPLFDMIPHRNGVWKNIEAKFVDVESGETIGVKDRKKRFEPLQVNKATDDEAMKEYKLVAYAHRDIKAGEPLRVSYNQCEHLGCEGLQYSYNSGHLIADGGFVEDYPRRFHLEIDPFESEGDEQNFVVEIDLDPVTGEKKFAMLKRPGNKEALYEVSAIVASLDRWTNVKEEIDEHTVTMEPYERATTVAYHEAYHEFIDLIWLHRNDPVIGDDTVNEEFDNLDQPAGPGVHFRGEYMACAEGEVVDNGQLLLDAKVKGFYQELEYFYESEIDNTYMKMGGWLHSASNFRAHYHESAIHVPLQYVKDVRRVAYIGGGDNMVLEEVLKYPNLELVVGMELDQQACRSSLKYFGTTPAFDDPRVEWWFGNAAKTVQIIPDDYFGSFDLVLVDLLNDVSEGIKVVVDLNLLEVAPLLMKQDGGVISRNEDYVDRSASSINLAKHVIAYEYWDVPRLCETSITIGSNSIDFLKEERYDHGVNPKLRLVPFNSTAHDGWSRYHDHSRPLDPESNDTAWTTFDPLVCDKIHRSLPQHEETIGPGAGALLVIEAENVTMDLNNDDSMHVIRNKIAEVAKANGMSLIDHFHASSNAGASFSVFNEGYIKAQVYPDVQYIAFDLMLWGTGDTMKKSKTIEQELVAAVGGGNTEDSISSYRITAGGMDMAESIGKTNRLVESALDYYCGGGSDVTDSTTNEDGDKPVSETDDEKLFDESIIISEILTKPFSAASIPKFAVLCGKEGTEECSSHASLVKNTDMIISPVYSCDSFEDMAGCKSEVEKRFEEIVSNGPKLDGIIIDRSVTLDMGRVLHKVFNDTLNQANFLDRTFAVLAPIPAGESWKKELLDRFRTEIIIAPPVLKADIDIYNDERNEEWSIVWIRHHNFLRSLQYSLAGIEERTQLKTASKRILPGSKPAKFDWNPRIIKDSEYYHPEVKEQWFGQKPLAYQYFVQMELGQGTAPVTVDEEILVALPEYTKEGWPFKEGYVKAKVLEVKDDKYVVEMMSHVLSNGTTISYGTHDGPVDRASIRKISPTEADRKYALGDIVLVHSRDEMTGEEIPIQYYAAFVLGISETGISTRPHDGDSEIGMKAHIRHESVMVHAESPEYLDFAERLSEDKLKEAFSNAAAAIGYYGNDSSVKTFKTGQGIVVTLVSSMGSAAMKWDGLNGVEVNLFSPVNFDELMTVFENVFKGHFKHLLLFGKDAFPRGYGKVVNFEHEIGDYFPHWIDDESDHGEMYEVYDYVDDDDLLDEDWEYE
eukprot:CAMPEP_0172389996 /NCGR_PEP_ID=MMETSP1061-20121228/6753_1 /TAXON_ID=37318 /ORGANISM="Pseudo-nitzschia pungens, Strain cf. pungens" /LENGTH=1559 /DNA_ID=CAMNT_0013120265 /DNA_START=57 /DNA_END=4736 /DNA_ORIENTATION=+